jgi:hypothetical protein
MPDLRARTQSAFAGELSAFARLPCVFVRNHRSSHSVCALTLCMFARMPSSDLGMLYANAEHPCPNRAMLCPNRATLCPNRATLCPNRATLCPNLGMLSMFAGQPNQVLGRSSEEFRLDREFARLRSPSRRIPHEDPRSLPRSRRAPERTSGHPTSDVSTTCEAAGSQSDTQGSPRCIKSSPRRIRSSDELDARPPRPGQGQAPASRTRAEEGPLAEEPPRLRLGRTVGEPEVPCHHVADEVGRLGRRVHHREEIDVH